VGDEARPDLLEIRTQADRAATLTRQLLAFSRRQALQPRVLDLNQVCVAMTGLLQRIIGEDVELIWQEDPALFPVEADPGQLEQVIMNLALNARDAMPEGGRLTIQTANAQFDQDFVSSHPGAVPGPRVLLAVSDTGHGMDEETLSHIFEPFFTTKDLGKGTGLGLSTVYGIVKQSGGGIWAQSEPGMGTTIIVHLPRAEKALDWSPTQTAGLAKTVEGGVETVLVVEDEPAVLSLTSRVLKNQGYTVLTAGSPDEAMRILDQHSSHVDLVLTDVVLPGMSGRTMADLVLERPGPTPEFLYMSGYAQDAIVHDGRLDEGVAFLAKPFTPDGLAAKVRQVLDHYSA
jgi:CheY-like chemotaxis protein